MSTLPRHVAALLLLALPGVVGCWGGGPRKPLFGGDDTGGAEAAPQAPAPRQRQDETPEAVLLRDLRRAGTDGERRALADQLAKRGAPVRDLVQKARDEEGLLVDLLDDVLRRIDAAAGTAATPQERAVAAAWVQDKYALALDRHLAGDCWGALRLIDAILALEPGTDQRPRLLRLRRRARDRILRESALVADLVPGATTLVPSQGLAARVRLTNVGKETITIRVGDGMLGVISVEYEEISHDGRRTRTRTERQVPAPPRVELQPGRAVELPVELPAPHATLDEHLVGRFHLGGRLRAHTLLVGDVPYPFYVPLLPVDVLVVHPRDLELSRDPRAAFHAAVQAGQQAKGEPQREAARRAFVSALLVAREDDEAAIAMVAAALEAHASRGAVEDALCAALARVTGEPLGFTRLEWLAWWQKQRSRPERLRAEEREARAEEQGAGEDDGDPVEEQKGARRRRRR